MYLENVLRIGPRGHLQEDAGQVQDQDPSSDLHYWQTGSQQPEYRLASILPVRRCHHLDLQAGHQRYLQALPGALPDLQEQHLQEQRLQARQ